jgi:hypothetical protein
MSTNRVKVMKIEDKSFESIDENMYRQSFHRFCDGLCEEILLFLPINDKIRLECVSKQFKRCLVKRQTILEISDNVLSRNNFKDCLLRSTIDILGRKIPIFNLKWRKLIKVVKKFTFINEIRINKKGLSKLARENALYIINAFCHQIKSMEFLFGSLSSIYIDLFAVKFGDNIKEIKMVCYKRDKRNNRCKCCDNILQFFNISCNKKCNVKSIYKNLLED